MKSHGRVVEEWYSVLVFFAQTNQPDRMNILILPNSDGSLSQLRHEFEMFIGLTKRGHNITIVIKPDSLYAPRLKELGIRTLPCYPVRKIMIFFTRIARFLFPNVNVFDGKTDALQSVYVLVEGKVIGFFNFKRLDNLLIKQLKSLLSSKINSLNKPWMNRSPILIFPSTSPCDLPTTCSL